MIRHTLLVVGLMVLSAVGVGAQSCGEHVIAAGDTLFRIAQQYSTTVDALVAANNIADPGQIFAGQRLVIPCAGAPITQSELITPANAERVAQVVVQDWSARPIELGVSPGETDDGGLLTVLDDAGALSIYPLDAPQTPPMVIGGEDGRFVYNTAASSFGSGLAVAEYFDTPGGSVVTISGFPTTADPTMEVNIPLEHGVTLTDLVLDADLLLTTVGDITGGPNPDTVPGIQMWPLLHGVAGDLFIPNEAPVTGLATVQSQNGRLVAAVGVDGVARVWDISSFASLFEPGESVLVGEFTPTAGGVFTGTSSSMAFSPDGRFLALGGGTGEIWLWNVANGTLQYLSVLNSAPVSSVAFSPDGTVLAMSGGYLPDVAGGAPPDQDNFIHLFDVNIFASGVGGAFLNTLTGHTAAVTGLAFSPDGTQLISIAADNTLRFWGVSGSATTQAPVQVQPIPPPPAVAAPSESGCSHAFFFGEVTGDCVDSEPSDIAGVYQYFEGGYMLWHSARNSILVLHSDSTVQTVPDTWNGQLIVTDGPPPADRFVPERGFGWVWNDQIGMRDRLGWALDVEQSYTMRWQSGHVDSPDPRPAGVEYYQWHTGAILRLTYYDGAVLWNWV